MIEIKHKDTGEVMYVVGSDNLQRIDLFCNHLIGADLSGLDLRGANLEGAKLAHSNLLYANLEGANLEGANLEGANLKHTNLRDANLRDTNLRDTNLHDANLHNADLNNIRVNQPLHVIHGLRWQVIIIGDYMQIGCQRHPIENWFEFSDDEIDDMDDDALEFWQEHKEFLLNITTAGK